MKARPAILSLTLLKTTILVLLLCSPNTSACQPQPLPNAFAHNDYLHDRPLNDALDNGYTNIEADVFLKGGKLIVAHINPFFKSSRTLETLYLKPLYDRVMTNNGRVFRDYRDPVILMIDIKTGAESTYAAIEEVLEKYKNILSYYDNGVIHRGAITVVLSGHKPYEMVEHEVQRYAFIDEDLRNVYRDAPDASVFKMASCRYSKLPDWRGDGRIPASEEARLKDYIARAHQSVAKVRLWASPENSSVWNVLLNCGVDLINTDELAELKNYLINRKAHYISAAASKPAKPADILAL